MTEPNSLQKCILVVDDDVTVREAITETLEYEGYCVESAADGQAALDKVEFSPPDAVVLDLMMPVMDGWTFLEHFRKRKAGSDTPILLTSAVRKLEETASELHVQACLAKPFDLDELLVIIARLVYPQVIATGRIGTGRTDPSA